MSALCHYKTIGIFSRPRRAILAEIVPKLLEWMYQRGVTKTLLDSETALAMNQVEKGLTRHEIAQRADLLLVLGGDGTLLAAAREAAPHGIPILPINLGGLGFLTSVTLEELYPGLEQTLEGCAPVSERVMLLAERVTDGTSLTQRVLNEAVVHKGTLARMIEVELFIDGGFVCRYRADGLIVATPTGSTAYSMSAGGPIVHPAVESILITPICPHSLNDRPVVVPDVSKIEVCVEENADSVFLSMDGQTGVPLQPGDRVKITRAKERLKLIHPPSKSYFEILRSKLKWGEA
jgi:NAD+ kinase